jgi:transposase
MTGDVLELADWLESCGVSHVAMESTGVYWKPIFNLLEAGELRPILVNARDIKQVPGRKTDVKDAEWIADLLRHGLFRPSFVPDRDLRELRELTRYRRRLIQTRASEAQRLQKVLEGANIKLSSVASDVLGVSGRAMLRALIEGVQEPQALAELARGQLKKKHVELERALRGSVGPHQRQLLRRILDHVEFLEQQIEQLNADVEERMRPFERELGLLDEIWGIGLRTAQDLLAELGTDMSRWPTSKHLASWAKICPGNNESGGKKRSGATGKGNPWLRAILIEAAENVKRNRESHYSALYHRIASRRKDKKKALMAVAHSLLRVIYVMLRDGVHHHDLGPNHFQERQQQRSQIATHHLRKLERLGYKVTLEEVA